MNASELAKELSPYLVPVLPYLVKGVNVIGKEIFSVAGKKIGKDTVEKIQNIWGRLWSKINQNPSAIQIAEQISAHTDDPRAKGMLEMQLESLFEDDNFRMEIEDLFLEAKSAGLTLSSVQEFGVVLGEVIGIKITSGKELIDSGITEISSDQKSDEVKAGGKVVGIKIGEIKSHLKQTKKK
jgi:hypothetical protein